MSPDRLVAQAANRLEATFPGQVLATEVKLFRPDGRLATDIDIDTRKAAIQVKSGSARGALTQAQVTAAHTSKPVIVYGPKLGWQLVRNLKSEGFRVARTIDELFQIYRGLG